MRVKDSTINIVGLRPELLFGLTCASAQYQKLGVEMVITSVCDGRHSPTSLHYSGCAADLRIWNLPTGTDVPKLVADIQEAVGADFDVILESDHIHMEFQPKRRGP